MIKIGNSALNISVYSCQPNNKDELEEIIKERIKSEGPECDLNDIDTSNITDMSYLFSELDFNGDISNWNVSNVNNMAGMFNCSKFNGDISKWNVSNVDDMSWMFSNSKFNQDISKWNVSNVDNMEGMFFSSIFNQEISNWNVSKCRYMCIVCLSIASSIKTYLVGISSRIVM